MKKRKLTQFEIEALERRARGAAAWGLYGVILREQNFNRELDTKNRAIKQAGSRENRERATREKEQFVERAKNDRRIHIGPF